MTRKYQSGEVNLNILISLLLFINITVFMDVLILYKLLICQLLKQSVYVQFLNLLQLDFHQLMMQVSISSLSLDISQNRLIRHILKDILILKSM